MTVTPHMLHLLHHTLGLRPDRRESFRNYFLAGPGHHDQADLEALESAGLMRRAKTPAFCRDGDVTFVCTDAGKAYAIDNLPPEPKRTKYEEYLHADCFDSFAAFMGINKPKYENRGYGRDSEFRMVRYVRRESWCREIDLAGEWCKTHKSAKESYKAALRARKEACHGRK